MFWHSHMPLVISNQGTPLVSLMQWPGIRILSSFKDNEFSFSLQNFIHGGYPEILIYGPIFLKRSKPTGLILCHSMSTGRFTIRHQPRMTDKGTFRLAHIGIYSDLLMKHGMQVYGWLQGKYPLALSHIWPNTSWQTWSLYQWVAISQPMLFTNQSTDGETTGGGFPGWVGNVAGDLRTNNPNYKDGLFPTDCRASCRSIRVAWTPYMTAISKIIARNQITEGGPSAYCQIQEKKKRKRLLTYVQSS